MAHPRHFFGATAFPRCNYQLTPNTQYSLSPWARKFFVISYIINQKIFTPTLKEPVLSSSDSHTSSSSNLTKTFISSHLDNVERSATQNNKDASNTYDINSCVTPRKQNISFQATSTPICLTLLNNTLPIAPIELHTSTKLPPVGNENLCFQIKGKSPHAAQCVKSRILNKAIDSILSIDTF